MYRRISDFLADWKDESKSTKDVLEALTDESLNQRVTPAGRSLSKLGWHIAQSLHMVTEAGLEGLTRPGSRMPSRPTPGPSSRPTRMPPIHSPRW